MLYFIYLLASHPGLLAGFITLDRVHGCSIDAVPRRLPATSRATWFIGWTARSAGPADEIVGRRRRPADSLGLVAAVDTNPVNDLSMADRLFLDSIPGLVHRAGSTPAPATSPTRWAAAGLLQARPAGVGRRARCVATTPRPAWAQDLVRCGRSPRRATVPAVGAGGGGDRPGRPRCAGQAGCGDARSLRPPGSRTRPGPGSSRRNVEPGSILVAWLAVCFGIAAAKFRWQ